MFYYISKREPAYGCDPQLWSMDGKVFCGLTREEMTQFLSFGFGGENSMCEVVELPYALHPKISLRVNAWVTEQQEESRKP